MQIASILIEVANASAGLARAEIVRGDARLVGAIEFADLAILGPDALEDGAAEIEVVAPVPRNEKPVAPQPELQVLQAGFEREFYKSDGEAAQSLIGGGQKSEADRETGQRSLSDARILQAAPAIAKKSGIGIERPEDHVSRAEPGKRDVAAANAGLAERREPHRIGATMDDLPKTFYSRPESSVVSSKSESLDRAAFVEIEKSEPIEGKQKKADPNEINQKSKTGEPRAESTHIPKSTAGDDATIVPRRATEIAGTAARSLSSDITRSEVETQRTTPKELTRTEPDRYWRQPEVDRQVATPPEAKPERRNPGKSNVEPAPAVLNRENFNTPTPKPPQDTVAIQQADTPRAGILKPDGVAETVVLSRSPAGVPDIRTDRQAQSQTASKVSQRSEHTRMSVDLRPDNVAVAALTERHSASSDREGYQHTEKSIGPESRVAHEAQKLVRSLNPQAPLVPVSVAISEPQKPAKLPHFSNASMDAPVVASDINLFDERSSDLRSTPIRNTTFESPAPRVAVISQIAEAVRIQKEGSVDVHLSPEELGRVRLSMTPTETGMAVSILAERPETIELIRRHAELLAQELRQQGHTSVAFSFGGDRGRPEQFAGHLDAHPEALPNSEQHPTQKPATVTKPIVSGLLDLRI